MTGSLFGLLAVAEPSVFAQTVGALTDRIIFTSAGHGWVYDNSADTWYTQRGDNNEVVEDYGNLDQMTLFVEYCLAAGATVVPMRPVGFQTNEVVLDNDSPGVRFVGNWSNSSGTVFFGEPGDVPYRFAALSASETATAIYTPTIPVAGFYPVYCWAAHGGNRTNQLYRIRHSGGQRLVRVPHHWVGRGWVYLGNYHFDAGSNSLTGAVEISNQHPAPRTGSVVIADAIRFGNGMGDVVPESTGGGTPTVSGYPREEEGSRYWIQRSLGQGQDPGIADRPGQDDGSDNVGAPIRMAVEMNRGIAGTQSKRVYLGFHSNAAGGTARGCVGLYNNTNLFPGTATPNQLRLAQLVATELNNDMAAGTWEVPWYSRSSSSLTYARSDYAFGEINNTTIADAFDAAIIETAFHDNVEDAKLLRDPKARQAMARASAQALVRYFNEFDGGPLVFLPEPPANVRAFGTNDGVRIAWEPGGSGGGSPNGYLVYRSTNGYGFGNPVSTSGLGVLLTNLAFDRDYYFRVTATNAGGESLFSACVGARRNSTSELPVLVVNAFDRFARALCPRQTAGPGVGGIYGGTETFDRVRPREMNSFDYVVQHGQALNALGVAFDACHHRAVENSQVRLTNYRVVFWAVGQESAADETFSVLEQLLVGYHLEAGGHLFVSGSEIAFDLGRDVGPSNADRHFLSNRLHAVLGGDANSNAGVYTFSSAALSIFTNNPTAQFGQGSGSPYRVLAPNRLTPVADGRAALRYVGGSGGVAAVQYDGAGAGGGRVVFLSVPFESIGGAAVRERYLSDVLRFFAALPAPQLVRLEFVAPNSSVGLTWTARPGHRYRLQFKDSLDDEWQPLDGEIPAAGTELHFTNSVSGVTQRIYRVTLVE
jgi:hypothetical protein